MDGAIMNAIATRAADLAISAAEDSMFSRDDYYQEYMDQLRTGDSQCLRTWIGMEVENGVRDAIEILKLWIRAELRRCVR